MEPKVFEDLDNMEVWAEENPDDVTRHLLEAWEQIIEGEKETITVVTCKPDEYFEDMNIVVKEEEAEQALEELLQESIEREDYEAARDITALQEKL